MGVQHLALLGGLPAFDRPLHVGRPNIGDLEIFEHRMRTIFEAKRLTNGGPMVVEFERRVAAMVGVRHCVATCNATLALQIAARGLELRGDVIVPAFTFVATAHALEWMGLRPVFCDVDPVTHAITADLVERALTPDTTGIVGLHPWGWPAPVVELQDFAARRGLGLLFDAAHAFGSQGPGRMIGGFGDAEVFSFHATKFLNTFEGGAVVTDDDALADRFRRMRNFGFAGYDHVTDPGINAKMAEPAAAMGLTNLDAMSRFIEVNRRNHELYTLRLAEVPGLRVLPYGTYESNYQYVVVETGPELGLSRDELCAALVAENVLARRYFYPGVHRMEPYRTLRPATRMPATERLCDRLLVLPNGTGVDASQIDLVVRLMIEAHRCRSAVRAELGEFAAARSVPS